VTYAVAVIVYVAVGYGLVHLMLWKTRV